MATDLLTDLVERGVKPDRLRLFVIESPNSGIRSRTRRVKNWQDRAMVVRWVAASLLDMEKRFKRIMGYQQLWILEAKLKDLAEDASVDTQSQVA